MKLTQLSAVVLLAGTIVFAGCKENSAKDLIVKKWKFSEISGPDAAQIPDSIKKIMFETSTMEFKKDGTYEQTGGMSNNVQKGTYSLSEDGKTLISKEEGSNADTVIIVELSKTKMVVRPISKDNGKNMQLTMVPK